MKKKCELGHYHLSELCQFVVKLWLVGNGVVSYTKEANIDVISESAWGWQSNGVSDYFC